MEVLLWRWYLAVVVPPERDERGDVPGWVLITVMTAGIVGALWQFAGPRLQGMLEHAINSVHG